MLESHLTNVEGMYVISQNTFMDVWMLPFWLLLQSLEGAVNAC